MALGIEYVKENHTGRRATLFIVLVIIGFLGWASYNWYTTGNTLIPLPFSIANSSVNESNVSAQQVAIYTVPALQPRYLSIPALHLGDTRVYPTGLGGNNLLITSSNIHDIAWYDKSKLPGSGGAILMEGHNKGVTKNGAFANLNTLKSGDKIIVERGDGQKYTYSVVDSLAMSLSDIDSKGMALMGKSAVNGKEGLNLITSDGKWVPRLGTFDRRIIVRAVIDSTK